MCTLMGRMARRELRGVVYRDSNNNGIFDKEDHALSGIEISLYSLREERPNGKDNIDMKIFREIPVSKVKTNEKGEYRFLADEGRYSIYIDTESLPDGMGVEKNSIMVDKSSGSVNNFPVKDVASIDVKDTQRTQASAENEVSLHAVLKDANGTPLIGNIKYSYDTSRLAREGNCFRPAHRVMGDRSMDVTITAGPVSRKTALFFNTSDAASPTKVRKSYENGVMDEGTKIRQYLYALFDKSKLSREYRSDIPIKSGTTIVEEIYRYIARQDADKDVRAEAERYFSFAVPKLDQSYVSPGGYFKIHYTTKGNNAVSVADANRNGIPDYIELIGSSFDNVKAGTCGTRGFRTPLLDKGAKSFDVYVYDLDGKYGITFPSSYYKQGFNGARTASSYISIDNTYSKNKGFKKSRDDCMKVTAAHEFFHAVQNAYSVDADTWWKEASATWNEDEIYSGVDDYMQYIDRVFSAPQKSLEQSSYGGVVFAKYLAENLGGYGMIKRIWEMQATSDRSSINVIDQAIRNAYPNEDIGTVFSRYAACNFNPSQYYKEGYLWTQAVAVKNTFTAYPVSTQSGKLSHLSASYELFKPSAAVNGKSLKIAIEGKSAKRIGFKVQKRKRNDELCDMAEIPPVGVEGRTQILLDGFGETYKEICLIPANLEKETDNLSYSYTVTIQ